MNVFSQESFISVCPLFLQPVMKHFNLLLSALLTILSVAMTSCETSDYDKPALREILSDSGTITLPVASGVIIKEKHNNLLTLSADYPMLKVASIFSLTSKAPEIAYIGQITDLVELPTSTDETFSTRAVIHNHGGYLIKMGVIKPGTNTVVDYVIKMQVSEGPVYEGDAPNELYVKYQIFHLE